MDARLTVAPDPPEPLSWGHVVARWPQLGPVTGGHPCMAYGIWLGPKDAD